MSSLRRIKVHLGFNLVQSHFNSPTIDVSVAVFHGWFKSKMAFTTGCQISPWKALLRALRTGACLVLSIGASGETKREPTPSNEMQSNEQCIPAASAYHDVNAALLKAILMVESGLNPWEVKRNSNGTLDVGMAGINSIHFNEIAKFGIAPEQLLDACVATYVAAWHLKKGIRQYGNTWFGIAAYHSVTPYFNHRYQIMVYNQLVKNKSMNGPLLKVPALQP